MVGLTGLPLMRRLILMVGLLTRLWLGSSGSLVWCSRRPWWCALVVLVRERCGSVWWCACVGSLWCGVPFGVPLCCGALLVLVGGPSAVGLSRSGTPGAWAWWLHPLGCASAVVRYWVAGSPTPWSVRLTRWCVLGCVRPGPWCPGCAGASAWCPYSWGAPHRGDHMGYPSECWSW